MCRLGTFKFVWVKMSVNFLQKKTEKEEKIIAAAQLAMILATRWTGNKTFLRVALLSSLRLSQRGLTGLGKLLDNSSTTDTCDKVVVNESSRGLRVDMGGRSDGRY